jgi:hypothetical protein
LDKGAKRVGLEAIAGRSEALGPRSCLVDCGGLEVPEPDRKMGTLWKKRVLHMYTMED